jgi:inositol-phosphate transport system ATP-binding protein
VTLGEGPFKGRIHDLEPHGRETIYHLETPLGEVRALEAGSAARFRVGDALSFAIGAPLLFDAASTRRYASAQVSAAP